MENLKLLITDIDGTLLNTQKQISNNTRNYLIDLQKKGVIVALCSGRIPSELKSFAKELELEKYGGYMIHTNGAGIINCKTKENIHFSQLKEKHIIDLVHQARKNKLYTIAQYNDSYVVECSNYVQFKRNLVRLFWPNSLHFKNPTLTQFKYMSKNCTRVHSVPDKVGAAINKLCFRGKPSRVDLLEKFIQNNDNLYNSFRITNGCVEVNRAGVSKGNAVEYLRKLLKLNEEALIAFGDSANDHEMLQSVINSVAMKNADEQTKSIAKYVSYNTNDEDGIVTFIQKNYSF